MPRRFLLLFLAGLSMAGASDLPPPLCDIALRPKADGMSAPKARYSAEIYLREVNASMRDRDFAKALPPLEYLQSWKPNDPDLLVLRGCIYAESGRVVEAESLFRLVTSISPGHPWARMNLAESLLTQKKFTEAEGVLEQFAMMRPESEVVRFKLVIALAQLRKFEPAKAVIAELQKKGLTAAYHFSSAALAFGQGDRAGGLRWVDKAETLFPLTSTEFFHRGLADQGWIAPRATSQP